MILLRAELFTRFPVLDTFIWFDALSMRSGKAVDIFFRLSMEC